MIIEIIIVNSTPSIFIIFQLTYKADSNQIGFLQLLSTHASQNITYNCKNSAAYYDRTEETYEKSVKLLSWNDAELSPVGSRRFKYSVEVDECQVLIFTIYCCYTLYCYHTLAIL